MAARALHLSRGVEKPSGRVTYIVVLEGLCRFNVEELSTRGPYCNAKISPLEMTKSGKLVSHSFFRRHGAVSVAFIYFLKALSLNL